MSPGTEKFPESLLKASRGFAAEVPSRRDTQAFVDEMIDLLFPFRTERKWGREELQSGLDG